MANDSNYLQKYIELYNGRQKLTLVKGTGLRKGELYGDGVEFLKKVMQFVQYVIYKKHRAISILDYGCGRAMHTHNPNYNMCDRYHDTTIFEHYKGAIQSYYCYDPGVPRYSVKPSPGSKFDLVAVPDVLEHVPEEFVDDVIRDSVSFLRDDGLFVATISNNLSYAHFLNSDGSLGDNLHCTLKPFEWWIEKFKTLVPNKAYVLVHCDLEYHKSIGSSATLRFHKSDSAGFTIDKERFDAPTPYIWVE